MGIKRRSAKAVSASWLAGLALLVLGVGEMDCRQYKDALAHLRMAEKRLPNLADYPAYLKAAAEYQLLTETAALTRLSNAAPRMANWPP